MGQNQLGCFSCCLWVSGAKQEQRGWKTFWEKVMRRGEVWGDSEANRNCMWLFPQYLPESGLYHLWFLGSNQPASRTAPVLHIMSWGGYMGGSFSRLTQALVFPNAAGPNLLLIDLSFLCGLEQPLEGQRERNLSKLWRKWHVRTEV